MAGELDDAMSQMEKYKNALEVEILERRAVIELLQQAAKFYDTEKNDAKVVFNVSELSLNCSCPSKLIVFS